MLKPAELTLEEMGDLAAIIPAADPEVKVRYRPIPDFDEGTNQSTRRSLIPVCEPTLTGNEMKYVQQAVETNWISSAGSFIREFEAKFAQACGVKYGIACANGTVAMHLAMATLGLEPGDEVIIPTFTMIATINAVTYCGATPVLVDMEPEYWQLDIEQVAAKITPRTKAIVPVHIYGHPTDMDPLMALAEHHGIKVIEDAAEAHGAEYKGKRTGGLGEPANQNFLGDYSSFTDIEFSVDVKTNMLDDFIGNPIARSVGIMLIDRDIQGPDGASGVFFELGLLGVNFTPDWTTLSVTIADPTVSGLPAGWIGFGDTDPNTFEPILPPGATFASVLAGVDEFRVTGAVPGFFYTNAFWDVQVDNISVTVPAPGTALLICAGLFAARSRRR